MCLFMPQPLRLRLIKAWLKQKLKFMFQEEVFPFCQFNRATIPHPFFQTQICWIMSFYLAFHMLSSPPSSPSGVLLRWATSRLCASSTRRTRSPTKFRRKRCVWLRQTRSCLRLHTYDAGRVTNKKNVMSICVDQENIQLNLRRMEFMCCLWYIIGKNSGNMIL